MHFQHSFALVLHPLPPNLFHSSNPHAIHIINCSLLIRCISHYFFKCLHLKSVCVLETCCFCVHLNLVVQLVGSLLAHSNSHHGCQNLCMVDFFSYIQLSWKVNKGRLPLPWAHCSQDATSCSFSSYSLGKNVCSYLISSRNLKFGML